MLKYLVLEYIKERVLTPQKSREPTMCMTLLIILGLVSIIIAECYLSYFTYNYLSTFFYYSDVMASMLTAVIFLLQGLLIFTAIYIKHNRAKKVGWVSEEKDKLKNITSAFLQGFRDQAK